jgi:hypothetical protein
VVATHVGYEAAAETVRIAPGDSTHRQISLSPRPIAAQPVVVTQTQRRHPEQAPGTSTLSAEALRQPGALGAADVLGQAGTLLGVHTQRPLADLHIRFYRQ